MFFLFLFFFLSPPNCILLHCNIYLNVINCSAFVSLRKTTAARPTAHADEGQAAQSRRLHNEKTSIFAYHAPGEQDYCCSSPAEGKSACEGIRMITVIPLSPPITNCTVLSSLSCSQPASQPAPGPPQHQMSTSWSQSKSDKHVERTSEEYLAACSSAISARESSYKKHLLHFVLSMML